MCHLVDLHLVGLQNLFCEYKREEEGRKNDQVKMEGLNFSIQTNEIKIKHGKGDSIYKTMRKYAEPDILLVDHIDDA